MFCPLCGRVSKQDQIPVTSSALSSSSPRLLPSLRKHQRHEGGRAAAALDINSETRVLRRQKSPETRETSGENNAPAAASEQQLKTLKVSLSLIDLIFWCFRCCTKPHGARIYSCRRGGSGGLEERERERRGARWKNKTNSPTGSLRRSGSAGGRFAFIFLPNRREGFQTPSEAEGIPANMEEGRERAVSQQAIQSGSSVHHSSRLSVRLVHTSRNMWGTSRRGAEPVEQQEAEPLTSSSSTCTAPLLHPEMFWFFQFHELEPSSTRPLARRDASCCFPAQTFHGLLPVHTSHHQYMELCGRAPTVIYHSVKHSGNRPAGPPHFTLPQTLRRLNRPPLTSSSSGIDRASQWNRVRLASVELHGANLVNGVRAKQKAKLNQEVSLRGERTEDGQIVK
ncbi:unnamed protein product [Pleuronectes platessa]|uniref:Uncharacterized protein n=1 Tax=Pleuronectes platessa TaxID=8262 RepID=A0A9N7YUE1_PLEPL|nr:unnamed protein product [Pleuronectes platessa]